MHTIIDPTKLDRKSEQTHLNTKHNITYIAVAVLFNWTLSYRLVFWYCTQVYITLQV